MAYGMKLTTIGAAKLLAAATDETEITFSKIVWGNAGGVAYEPTGEETALVNQIHETNVLAVDIDDERPNVYRVDGELTSAPSEFTLLEVGILDEDNDLIAIGNHPPQFVPGPSSSFTLNYHPSWFLVISPALAVAVTLAPPGDFATEEWVTANFQAKGTYVKTVEGQDGVTVTGSATDRVAKADKSWFDARYKAIDAEAPGVESVNEGWAIDITGSASDPVVGVDKATLDAVYRGINNPFPLQSHRHNNATQSTDGYMSAEDKTKLDGLGGGIGGSLYPKVQEVIVSSATDYIDLLNIVGYKIYMVRWTGVRVNQPLPAGGVAMQMYVQTGKNSTLYAAGGDYDGAASSYPLRGGGGPKTGPDGPVGAGMLQLQWLNQTAKKTREREPQNASWQSLFLCDEDGSDTSANYYAVRNAATEENRIRFFLPAGTKFTAGRFTVYGVGG